MKKYYLMSSGCLFSTTTVKNMDAGWIIEKNIVGIVNVIPKVGTINIDRLGKLSTPENQR